jgi:hypothetical protein
MYPLQLAEEREADQVGRWAYENGRNPKMYHVANDDDDDDDGDNLNLSLSGCGLLYFRRWLPLCREQYCFSYHGRKFYTRKLQPICQLTFTVHDRPMSCLVA